MAAPPLIVAAAGRPHPSESVNGDAWLVQQSNGVYRVAVIDGLGHGPEAAAAAELAVRTLAAHPESSPSEALCLCHTALHGSRGAAIALAVVETEVARLTYAGIGNIEARLWQSEKEQRLISYRGIVGSVIPTVRSFEMTLSPGWLLIMHTDGLSSRFELADFPSFQQRLPQALAGALLASWSRPTDDAMVVVVCPEPTGVDR
ncbi:MAG: SpoIIE family protein phosphatase [Chloroflexota bacterium]